MVLIFRFLCKHDKGMAACYLFLTISNLSVSVIGSSIIFFL